MLLDRLTSCSVDIGAAIFSSIKKMWMLMTEHLNVSPAVSRVSSSSVKEQSTLVMNSMVVCGNVLVALQCYDIVRFVQCHQ